MIAMLLAIFLSAWFACGLAGVFAALLLHYREKGHVIGPLDDAFICWGLAFMFVWLGPYSMWTAIQFAKQLRAGDEYLRQIRKGMDRKKQEAAP